MTILHTTIQFVDGGDTALADTVLYEDGLWLVPKWSEVQSNGLIYPIRLIRIDRLRYQKAPPNNRYGADYILNDPLPRGLFDSQIPQQLEGKFDVLEKPFVGFQAPLVQ